MGAHFHVASAAERPSSILVPATTGLCGQHLIAQKPQYTKLSNQSSRAHTIHWLTLIDGLLASFTQSICAEALM